jgi:hypothetical protein
VLIELKLEFSSPAMIYQVNGAVAPWIRYAEWLLTCPVCTCEVDGARKKEVKAQLAHFTLTVAQSVLVVYLSSTSFYTVGAKFQAAGAETLQKH